jgi:hypothetical protein
LLHSDCLPSNVSWLRRCTQPMHWNRLIHLHDRPGK